MEIFSGGEDCTSIYEKVKTKSVRGAANRELAVSKKVGEAGNSPRFNR